nr:immunoglobulin heavy chain junction region [Macaca mulatta]MOV53322.1 immunoglobulin heavy chain junction region [Macaca mulatta]MOV53370.1 immunoglobulin heavy chain junction region [Macaca mulatta]MOV53375.1 immunoglobulin heavy chain junction region [Macaca mulatta]MOV53570.1 immunoglobulin heavy chain junction region [Macaca mulatta]
CARAPLEWPEGFDVW